MNGQQQGQRRGSEAEQPLPGSNDAMVRAKQLLADVKAAERARRN